MILWVLSFCLLALGAFSYGQSPEVRTGLDNVQNYTNLFAQKRIGIITNHTAYDRMGRHILDIFLEMKQVQVTALFAPEHGIRGEADAGAEIKSAEDPLNKIPVFSLYGQDLKPTNEMLQKVDMVVFDIQDIGSRFYTYIWTMALAMEAAAEQGKTFLVLDRPNPINGVTVEGNILEPQYATFVGLYPIPVRHGMTVGELARMFNGEGWLKGGIKADLQVIPLSGWSRRQWLDQTGLTFYKPSPNMPSLQTATVYPGLCLLEGTNVSEGRGTKDPFLQFGAPWIDSKELTCALNALKLSGLRFEEHAFTPVSLPGMSTKPKYEGQRCYGSRVIVSEREQLESYWAGIQIIGTIKELYPERLEFRVAHFDRLLGTSKIRQAIIDNSNLEELKQSWQLNLAGFRQIRDKYLLYEGN